MGFNSGFKGLILDTYHLGTIVFSSAGMWRSVVTFPSRKSPVDKIVSETVSWKFTFRDKRRSRYHAIRGSAASNATTAKRGVTCAQGLLRKVRLRCDRMIMEYTYKEHINVLLYPPTPSACNTGHVTDLRK